MIRIVRVLLLLVGLLLSDTTVFAAAPLSFVGNDDELNLALVQP